MKLLSTEQIKDSLTLLGDWKIENDTLVKVFHFNDFPEALAFVVRSGIEAEKMDHHPDLLLFGWNKVKVSIFTHSLGGLTEKDFNLAQQIDKIK
ncbi:MAG TPA: 4a-hydroxytetrahydrobiopterin dehydratase [Melioribacteraceae bacterium]|nr:4a-hydroxytetrahydrobiopterin dehydratase [Melioribacteraceae bacterium]